MHVLVMEEAEVEAIRSVPCPYYRSAAPIRLHSLKLAVEAAVRKCGSWSAAIENRE